mgnify:FL=1
MDGMKPVKKPSISDVTPVDPTDTETPRPEEKPAVEDTPLPSDATPGLQEPKKRRKWPWVLLGLVVAIAALVAGVWMWYQVSLSPVEPGSNQLVSVDVKPGTDAAGLAALLKQKDVIRSEQAFQWYVKMQGVSNTLQAGPYKLSRGSSVPTIVIGRMK